MKFRYLLVVPCLFLVALFSCHKEHSKEGLKQEITDTTSNYPYATGYCDGVSLGITIVDTSYYLPTSTDSLPDSLLLDMPVPGNQGSQGSCTAWATVYGVGSYYNHLKTGKAYSDTGNLSPKFTYNQITRGNCTCTSFIDNLYLLKTQGACSLNTMPYNPDECIKQPDSLQRDNAEIYKINDWRIVNSQNLALIKRAIFERSPVLFAINVTSEFNTLSAPYIWKTRVSSVGSPHALIIVGYNDAKKVFRIMNSWGTTWADKGFAWIDYDFFKVNVLSNCYIVI